MYYYNPYMNQSSHMHQYTQYPYLYYPHSTARANQFDYVEAYNRQQVIHGQATWTTGGQVTKCGIPWSTNNYMTVAVGDNSPYQCGEAIKVRNPANGREVIVTIVDEVRGFPNNRINLHRRVFETLSVNIGQGTLNVEIIPSPELEEERWGKYLLELVQIAYRGFDVSDYRAISKTEISANRIKETFDFELHRSEEQLKIRGNVVYNPETDRVLSFNLAEV
ncbi:DUF3889 domain-containing protein [Ornithinibacillus sp. FSL M8-0202]|uniref:DUF3889 domain-containing protein n=1 Tax=Ornithinibacillus sp. FSL M8-0202 TaxID=2921616 RepID=UPI0030CCDC9E